MAAVLLIIDRGSLAKRQKRGDNARDETAATYEAMKARAAQNKYRTRRRARKEGTAPSSVVNEKAAPAGSGKGAVDRVVDGIGWCSPPPTGTRRSGRLRE
jgi:hypothetical protein